MRHKLLFDTNPLVVIPELAVAIGLNESIVLQQIHYWLRINETKGHNFRDGRYWTYNSVAAWTAENFPWWSEHTVRRTLASLRATDKEHGRGPLLLTANYNKMGADRTLWYTIDYDEFDRIVGGMGKSCVQSGQMDVSKMHQPIPETTTETTHKLPASQKSQVTEVAYAPGEEEDLEYVPVEGPEDAGDSQASLRQKSAKPETNFQRELLAVCKAKWFKPRQKTKVTKLEKCLAIGTSFHQEVDACRRCIEELQDCTEFPDRPIAIPLSWYEWRAEHARQNRWSVYGFLSALFDRDKIVRHCQVKLKELGVPGESKEAQPPSGPVYY